MATKVSTSYTVEGGSLLIHSGYLFWHWHPDDDWEGSGTDYPPPGSRAIGEWHSTRQSGHGWAEWERTTLRNIKIDNILERLEAAGYTGTVHFDYDEIDDNDVDPEEAIRRLVPLQWVGIRGIEKPEGWTYNDVRYHLKHLVADNRVQHKELFGRHYFRRKFTGHPRIDLAA